MELTKLIQQTENNLRLLKEARKIESDIKVYQNICVDVEKDPHYGQGAKKLHLAYYHKQIDVLRLQKKNALLQYNASLGNPRDYYVEVL